MLFTRAWWNHFLRSWNRPAGVPEGGPLAELAKNASRVPRTPRFVTALLLVASLSILLVPDVRRAIVATAEAWGYQSQSLQQSAEFAHLRKEADRNQDPQLLAFMALLSEDANERARMANEAVRLDASLTWIYCYVHAEQGPWWPYSVPQVWINRLQEWDPDNAIPRLLVAQEIHTRYENEWIKAGQRSYFNPKPSLAQDPAWLTAMDSAFAATKYDTYYPRLFELYRTVSFRYAIKDRMVALGILQRLRLWGAADAGNYSELLFARGEAAEHAGNLSEAADLYWKPALFAERVRQQSTENWDHWTVGDMQIKSYAKLQPLLARMGRTDESNLVGYNLKGLQARAEQDGWQSSWLWRWARDGWVGFLIRFLTEMIFLLGVLSIIALTVLFFHRRTGLESRGRTLAYCSLIVDFCPLLVLIASGMLYATYRPLAVIYERYMSAPYQLSNFDELTSSFYVPYMTPEGLDKFTSQYFTEATFWTVAIVGLSILAVWILFRGALRRRAIPAV